MFNVDALYLVGFMEIPTRERWPPRRLSLYYTGLYLTLTTRPKDLVTVTPPLPLPDTRFGLSRASRP